MSDKIVTVFGSSSTLTGELQKIFKTKCYGRSEGFDLGKVFESGYLCSFMHESSKFIINIGLLRSKQILNCTRYEAEESMYVNCLAVIRMCEEILDRIEDAEIVIIGSESGTKGSFDTCYFLANAAINSYVRERKVSKLQRLLVVAPSTIEDSNMTKARTDLDRLEIYRTQHPKGRFLRMSELAELIALVFDSSVYFTNDVIEFNGGKLARM